MSSTINRRSRWSRPAVVTAVATGVIAGSVFTASPAYAAPSMVASQPSNVHDSKQSNVYDRMVAGPSLPRSVTLVRPKATAFPPMPSRFTVTSLSAARSVIYPGQSVKFTGRVTTGKGRVVASGQTTLQLKAGSRWKAVATTSLSSRGLSTFSVTATRTGTYRLSFPGSDIDRASVSSGRQIIVKPAPVVSTGSSYSKSSWSTVAPSGTGAAVVAYARAQIGKPYVYAAAGPDSFDCSGLTQYVFRHFGVSLPHQADSQKSYGRAVSLSEARPGDLVIFLSGGYGYHAAIYSGSGRIIDAPEPGRSVGERQMWDASVVVRRLV